MLTTLLTAALLAGHPGHTPEKVTLDDLRDAAEAAHSSTLAVARGGHTVGLWRFDGPRRPINVQSITKSVTALALGPLVGSAKLPSLAAPLAPFFPAWQKDGRRAITLRHLLAHTTGLSELPDGSDLWKLAPDVVALAASAALTSAPDQSFRYSSKTSNLLGEVIEQASGKKLVDWTERTLFEPLGIREAPWLKDAYGHPWVSGGLALDAEALLAIGQLMLQQGTYKGRTLVSKAWVATLVRPADTPAGPVRGLYWWLHRPEAATRSQGEADAFYAHGTMGQWLVVVPSRNLVVVRQYDMMRGIQDENAAFADFATWAARLEVAAP